MAPVDRREHRQQRVRGAGPSSVQAAFGFNFGALGAKQASLPPPPPSRRTPGPGTPRQRSGSVQRPRSASVQRSASSKFKATPRERTVTPQTGKRKRPSPRTLPRTLPPTAEDLVDELSPERDETAGSVEKSRRIARTVSPIREAVDEEQDELSFVAEDETSTTRKPTVNKSASPKVTPTPSAARRRASSGGATEKTPSTTRSGSLSRTARQAITRRSKSVDPGPVTPGTLPKGRRTFSPASPSEVDFTVIGVGPGDESEDELATPEVKGITPKSAAKARQSPVVVQEDEDVNDDELFSPTQFATAQETTVAEDIIIEETPTQEPAVEPIIAHQSVKPSKAERAVQSTDVESPSAPAKITPAKRGRPRKIIVEEQAENNATPIAREPGKRRDTTAVTDEADEHSPDTDRATQRIVKPAPAKQIVVELSGEESEDEYAEPHVPDLTPRLTTTQHSPGDTQRVKAPTNQPPRKRQKFSGPKQAISVMRIKGSTVRGVTVADTTRTLLEETIDRRLNRIAEKMQNSQDRDRRKELRSQLNLSLSFKESLNEKLLDLQDANDVLTSNFKSAKIFKRDNVELRREILALQNSRQEIALEHDHVQAKHKAHKAKIEARNTLSANMFEIEAAIKNGRRKALAEGRESEGPEVPLSMLLESVGRSVGSFGGGLLANVKSFNSALERTAGWLEGRA